MKKLFTLGALLFAGTAFAQTENVGIGTAQPDKSAILDLSSSNKGFLLPRMSENQRLNILKPAQGLQVYQTDGTAGLYVYNGKDWENASKSVSAATDPWLRGGNAAVVGEFIGTTNSVPLEFKSYNLRVGYIDPTIGNVSLGLGALSPTTTGTSNLAIGTGGQGFSTSGTANVSVGTNALRNVTSGGSNIALGYLSLFTNTTGSLNMGIGSNSLYHTTGTGNTAIGNNSGYFKDGDYNVYIGNEAGRANSLISETGKLYIHSAALPPSAPLIGGDFVNNNLKINVGPTSNSTTGFLAIGDFSAVSPMNTVGGYRLIVQDGILTEKIKVAVKNTGDWADYVFEDGYSLLPLEKIESYVREHKHLPNVPSAQDMTKEGLDVMKMNSKLLEKIEELTLYVIKLNNDIKELKK
jgi:hypothetical protein